MQSRNFSRLQIRLFNGFWLCWISWCLFHLHIKYSLEPITLYECTWIRSSGTSNTHSTAMLIIWTIIWLTWYCTTWEEMQPEWKLTLSLVHWYTSTNIAREYFPEASWPWMLFDLSMQISLQYICKLFRSEDQATGEGHNQWIWAITADHLADLEFGGDWYSVHQPEGPLTSDKEMLFPGWMTGLD